MPQEQVENINNEIDFESFQKSKNELDKYSAGMARIKSNKLITSIHDLPNEYRENSHVKENKYFQLTAEKNESEIIIIIPLKAEKNDALDFCYDWTGANSIDYLAGKRIPVRNISGNIFTVERFNHSGFEYIPLNFVKKLIKRKSIYKQIDGNWKLKNRYKILLYSIIIAFFYISISITYSFTDSALMSLIIPYIILKLYKYILKR